VKKNRFSPVWVLLPLGLLAALAASAAEAVPPSSAPGSLLDRFRAGPMAHVQEIIFAARKMNETDGHWYANLGYYAHDANRKAWREGAKLYRWNLATGKLMTLLDDAKGGIRDPQVSYDGGKILFSYRKGGTENYLLYEMNIDGSGLRQLTSGPFDDIEPTYLPNNDIVFVSTRCKRWVNCWLTQVAVMYRCDPNGQNIRAISSNNEQDNTPWPMPDGRLLYTRWEYVDRSQVDYHHLWVSDPDGALQTIWFGNLHPSIVMIDAKPIPGSGKVVAIFSPGHGQREHAGTVTIVDPRAGPDEASFARPISRGNQFRDPWAFSEESFMGALDASLVLLDASGEQQEIFRLPKADVQAGMHLHEPRPLASRPREPVIAEHADPKSATGHLILADIYEGRNMAGVRRGEIKKLLVLETLPMPIHYTGGMDPISYGGTFTLERIVGTVPVEPDGSAYMELPALRSFFFVALDENDLSVKRMQSFLTVQPGETTSCVGCHEQRTRTPQNSRPTLTAMATRHPPSRIQPIADVPDVIDFPRDIQPVLDALCVQCHGYEKTARGGPRAGRLILSGHRGPMFSHSYYMLTVAGLFSDGRNQPRSNYAPRQLGSSASRLLRLLDGSHYGVKATDAQKKLLRLWIDSGAAYPGTYAALGTGMIGAYAENEEVNTDAQWPTSKAAGEVIGRRCASCHNEPDRLLPRSLSDERGVSFWQPALGDPRLNTSRHIVFNLSRPEDSLLLLAPLAESAGGWGLCRDPKSRTPALVFSKTSDPDYQALLAMCAQGKQQLDQIKRFDMPGFTPRVDWVREMKRYGVLELNSAAAGQPMDVYALERRYWESLWYQPTDGVIR
jgi:Hydrazine synthase alpha subunit middle domain